MRYHSTRHGAPPADFNEVLLGGLAPDGGLYQPDHIPVLPNGWNDWGYVDSLAWSLGVFGAEDSAALVEQAATEYLHPDIAPIVQVGDKLVFELFWGPTLSFKDHALQVLGRLLGRAAAEPRTVLGATSGDTGSAAIAGCKGSPNLTTVILYPAGMVTDFQRRQMTTVPDDNVVAVAVRGNFDDCQRLVKEAFAVYSGLLAVNSINWARIAAQAGYYVFLGAQLGDEFDVVIPTGNFGNAYASWVAKQMGVPIDSIIIANNANHRLADVINGEPETQLPVTATVAPAMDIAAPSNFERFPHDPTVEFVAGWVGDEIILETIANVQNRFDYLVDPHTATAWSVGDSHLGHRPQVVVSTAHPAKFADAVMKATGHQPALPTGYPSPVSLPERIVTIEPDLDALARLIQ